MFFTILDKRARFCFRVCYLSLFFVVALFTPPQRVFSAEPGTEAVSSFTVGVLLGLTGPGATYSHEALNAIQLAVNEINSQGGLLGKHPIRIIVKDTLTSPVTAANAASDLIHEEKVCAIIGTYSSAAALAIKPILRDNKIIHFATISNSEAITLDDFSPYTFSVVPNTYMQAKAAARGIAQLAEKEGWTSWATIASDYDWGRSTQGNVVKFLAEEAPELKLVAEVWPRLGELRFTHHIAELAKAQPDFIFGSLASTDNIRWLQTANKVGFFEKFPYPGSLISVTELILQGDILPRGIIGLARAPFFAHLDNPMMQQFVENYRVAYQSYPSDWAVMQYDAIQILKQGIEASQSPDPVAIQQSLRNSEFVTTRGTLFFRRIDNQLSCSSYLGRISDSDNFPFPILADLIEIPASESWRSEEEIRAIREGRYHE